MRHALGIALAACAVAFARGEEAPAPRVTTFLGAADASAAEFVDETIVVVADDEDNVLRFYDATAAGAPRHTLDLSRFLGLAPEDESDLEGAARLGDRVYWITSHGRDRKGRERRSRGLLFATAIARAEGRTTLSPVGRPFRELAPALVQALEAQGVPVSAGLNIEALTASANGKSLYIGLRDPKQKVRGGRHAIVVPLLNPAAVTDAGKPPEVGRALFWDLGGGGVRSLLWSPVHREYFVLADAGDGGVDFRLYRWSGDPESKPVEETASFRIAPGFKPEALATVPGTRRLLVLGDDGDRRIHVDRAADCERGAYRTDGTCRNKDLLDAGRKSFRGFEWAR